MADSTTTAATYWPNNTFLIYWIWDIFHSWTFLANSLDCLVLKNIKSYSSSTALLVLVVTTHFLPYSHNRSLCIFSQLVDWCLWPVDTRGKHPLWGRLLRAILEWRCHCPMFANCDYDGCRLWPLSGSVHLGCHTFESSRDHRLERKWHPRLEQC